MPIAPLIYVMKGVINGPPYQDVTWRVYGTPDLTGAQSGYSNLINILVDYIIEDELAGTSAVAVEEQTFLAGDASGPSNNNIVTMTGDVTGRTSTNIVTMTGDVTGRTSANTVVKLQGRPMAATAPILDQTIQWDGSQWIPSTITTDLISLVFESGATTTTRTITVEDNDSHGTMRTNLSIIGQFGGDADLGIATTDGGDLNFIGGPGGHKYSNPIYIADGSNGGAINITGGAGGIGSTTVSTVPSIGGRVNITGGAGGTGYTGSNGGDIYLTGGTGISTSPTPSRGGSINITGGSGETGGSDIIVNGGTATLDQGGSIIIAGGVGHNPNLAASGGDVHIHGGNTDVAVFSNADIGGSVFIQGGNDITGTGGTGGNVTIAGGGLSGSALGTLNAGHLYLQGGGSSGGIPGHIYIDGGLSTTGTSPNPNRGEVRIGTVAGAAKIHIKSIGTGTDALFLESDGYAAITVGSNKNITLAWASSPGTGRIDFANISTATSATAGTHGDVPAQVVGYLNIIISGTAYKIPYYNT